VAHAIWSGAINFGLVTIPVKLQTAIRTRDLRFNFLHKKDEGRINNVRRCSVCEKEVPYSEIERGYEYEKGQYVILSDEDFDRVNPEATQSVEIVQFVDIAEINPMFFDRPYYLEPEKKGRHAYALLREALVAENKVGIARVVIRSKEHLAALKPNGEALVLELMHFADEIVDQETYDFPSVEKPNPGEMKVAKMLIDTMSEKFEPEKFHDKYREEVMAMIEARASGKEAPKHKPKVLTSGKVVNLMDVLQQSLEQTRSRRGGRDAESKAKRSSTRRKRSAA
jgi:DNA end-binding protein Ku